MSIAINEILASGHALAEDYRQAVNDLGRHWPDEIGVCLGCGEVYPCAEEWAASKAITVIESRWRREGQRLREQESR